jgi:hypothetical protein
MKNDRLQLSRLPKVHTHFRRNQGRKRRRCKKEVIFLADLQRAAPFDDLALARVLIPGPPSEVGPFERHGEKEPQRGDAILVRAGEVVPVDGVNLSSVAHAGRGRGDRRADPGEPQGGRARAQRRGGLRGDVRASRFCESRREHLRWDRPHGERRTNREGGRLCRMADRYALILLPVTLIVAAGA